MGVPQHRRSKSRNRKRRAEVMKLTAPILVKCPQCHEYKLPHRVCSECGYYNDRLVVTKKAE